MHGVIFLVAIVFIIVAVVSALQSGQRRKQMQQWAARVGWRYVPGNDDSLGDRYDFDCLQRGRSRYAYNVCQGQWGDLPALAFDYHYVQGSGKNRKTYNFSAVIVTSSLPLKGMMIRPENFFDKVTEFFGMDDIDFESAEFSRRFFVKADDRRWAYDVLHQRAMEFLLASPEYSICFDRRYVIAWRGRRMDPGGFEAALNVIKGLLDGLPEYVVRQQTQEC
ncbi:MAG: hypothetical protein ACYS8X_05690 [Planctomycetota bacterium]